MTETVASVAKRSGVGIAPRGRGSMLGLDRLKYRSEVIVQIHAILKLMPALTQLLETFPTLKSTINELRKQKMPPSEAACSLSVLVIERALAEIPDQAPRLLTLEQLKQNADNEFRLFSQIAQELAEDKLPRRDVQSDRGSRVFALVRGLSGTRRPAIAESV